MTVPGNLSSPLLATAADAAAAAVATKSLRFNSGDSSSLTRTPSSASNRKTWTWAAWVKISKTDSTARLFQARDGSSGNQTFIQLRNDNKIYVAGNSDAFTINTDALFRDPGAWGHLCVSFDTTQSTAADRIRIFWNGVQQDVSGTQPSQDYSTAQINSTLLHSIGNDPGTNGEFFNGYLADIYLIDGSRLEPTSFGAYDDNGVWQAAVYSGTYGTNGFHLAFGDSSSNAALGTDSSGNDNTFTVNNLSVAPGLATANQGFDVVTYTGNGSSQAITGLNFQPDFVWIKNRDEAINHALYDVVRGNTKVIFANKTESEATVSDFTSFDSNGFTVAYANRQETNKNTINYVAFCWKAGGSASSNTDGTITSSVSANDTYGFSVINHTGTGAAGTFGHGLSSAPDWLIFKNREATDNWFVWHSALNSATTGGVLNNTNAFFTNGTNELNSTLPTDSVIHVGNNLATNGSGQEVICYAWTEKSGFSKFGSYTGNGSTDGPTVTLGFRPRYILLRSTSGSRAWCIYDTERDTSTTNDNNLFANNNSAESSDSSHNITILDNGFKLATTSVNRNGNGETYIYMAFAAKPNGAANDSLFDVPTNDTTNTDSGAGGEVSGNYAVWNPLSSATTLSNGNLDSNGTGGHNQCLATIGMSSGKWYFETTIVDNTENQGVGIALKPEPGTFIGNTTSGYLYYGNGTKRHNTTNTVVADSFTDGDVIGIAFDADNGNLYFYKNGVAQISGSAAFTGLTSGPYFFTVDQYDTSAEIASNFGQRPFAYSAPSGYKALCTTNLPTPTIADGSDYFDAKLWTGNSTDQRAITGYQFSPDWVWIKRRNASYAHPVMDTVRGLNSGHAGVLYTNATNAEDTGATSSIRSFNSDGFNLGTDGGVNLSGSTYVGWAWDAGSSTVSNTDGSITSSVRANPSAGFSIVAYTGNGSAGATVGHGLNAAPSLIIRKSRSASASWFVYHSSLGATKYILLQATNASQTSTDAWNDTAPTSSVFSNGSDGVTNNGTFVAYCFAPVAGYSAFGSYTGNASTNGPFVHTGFRPALVIIKCSSTSNAYTNWDINDSARDTFNVADATLAANLSDAENTVNIGTQKIDFLSNGFKIRQGTSSSKNLSGATYVWAAWAENPFQANGGLAR